MNELVICNCQFAWWRACCHPQEETVLPAGFPEEAFCLNGLGHDIAPAFLSHVTSPAFLSHVISPAFLSHVTSPASLGHVTSPAFFSHVTPPAFYTLSVMIVTSPASFSHVNFTCFLQSCYFICFPLSWLSHRLFSSVVLLHYTVYHLSLFTNFSGLVNKLQWQRGSAPLLSITGQPCHGVILSPGHCSSPGSPSASEGSRDTVRGSWETKQRGSLHAGIGKEDWWWQWWEWDTRRSQLPISTHGEGGLQDSEASFCWIFSIHLNYTVATIIV